jgi:hypothetical protein
MSVSTDPLETFLYLLLRDCVLPGDAYGKLQEIEKSIRAEATGFLCSNEHLVEMAVEILARLNAAKIRAGVHAGRGSRKREPVTEHTEHQQGERAMSDNDHIVKRVPWTDLLDGYPCCDYCDKWPADWDWDCKWAIDDTDCWRCPDCAEKGELEAP